MRGSLFFSKIAPTACNFTVKGTPSQISLKDFAFFALSKSILKGVFMKTCTIILEIMSTLINFRWTVVRFLFRFSFSQIFRHVISNLNHIFKLP